LQAQKLSLNGLPELASKLTAAEEKLAATEKEVKEVLNLSFTPDFWYLKWGLTSIGGALLCPPHSAS